MTRTAYQQSLDELRQGILDIGALVLRRFEQGLAALVRHDSATGTLVQEGDQDIDRATAAIERTCIELLTLQQPVAGDIRFVTAAFRIVTDLERIGDLSVNLADYADDSETLSMVPPKRIEQVGRVAIDMLRDAMRAFADSNVFLAAAVIRRDDELDDLAWSTTKEFLTALHHAGRQAWDDATAKRHAEEALPILLSMRDLERAGDHAVNISRRVMYIVSGELPDG
ncbi:MAG: phosphate signaling complex protein PhoU [Planctomycetes bacterium]|nr:phosphate signaling complex protein PhoU [Planctomycetota bacterium]